MTDKRKVIPRQVACNYGRFGSDGTPFKFLTNNLSSNLCSVCMCVRLGHIWLPHVTM